MIKKRQHIISGIDIGTTKVAVSIGKIISDNKFEVIGLGSADTFAHKGGTVVNLADLADAVTKAAEEAGQAAKVKLTDCYINYSNPNIKYSTTRGIIKIASREVEVSQKDIDKVINIAKTTSLPFDRQPIFSDVESFILDDDLPVKDPIGMFGIKLEVNLRLASALSTSVENITKAVNYAGIEVKDVVLSNYATSLDVLTDLEKEIGTILIDIGGSLTEISVFLDGALVSDTAVGMGADSITEAIASGLKVSKKTAQRLKVQYGSLSAVENAADEKLFFKDENVLNSISRKELYDLIKAPAEELLTKLKEIIEKIPHIKKASSGIVLVGRPAMMDGFVETLESKMQIPARAGTSKGVSGRIDGITNPIYATSLGLVQYAFNHHKFIKELNLPKNPIERAKLFAKHLIRDYF